MALMASAHFVQPGFASVSPSALPLSPDGNKPLVHKISEISYM
jgi:hypothetical protein